MGVNQATLYGALKGTGLMDSKGVCLDAEEPLPPAALQPARCVLPAGDGSGATREVPAEHFSLRLHAFEPVTGNVDVLRSGLAVLLEEAQAKLQEQEPQGAVGPVEFTVHPAAVVGDHALREITFGTCQAGIEKCGVGTDEGEGGAENLSKGASVAATTIDRWLAETPGMGADAVIDVLAIDAEGHDPEVLKGAQGLLSRQGARTVLFEYHGVREWKRTDLKDVVERLDGLGYTCYLLQQEGVALRLTGCWHASFEFKKWSNVMCARRGHGDAGLVAALEAFTPLGRPTARAAS